MKSNATQLGTVAFAASLLLGTSVIAQTMTYSDYRSGKSNIKAEYKVEKKSCAALAGNAKDICVEQAKGKENIAEAELYARYKPSLKSHYKVQVAKAEAIYEVAKEQCDDLAGNPKDVCVKEAKAALTAAKANASVEMKTQAATEAARVKSSAAQSQVSRQTAEIVQDAATEKRAALYKVEQEKCDTFAASAKDNCLKDAQTKFGKL